MMSLEREGRGKEEKDVSCSQFNTDLISFLSRIFVGNPVKKHKTKPEHWERERAFGKLDYDWFGSTNSGCFSRGEVEKKCRSLRRQHIFLRLILIFTLF